jgi:hypothetical protein
LAARPLPYALEVPVTAEEARTFVFAAELSRESLADHLRRQLGLVPERYLAVVKEHCERELARERLRPMAR